jgi:hypothetical protein
MLFYALSNFWYFLLNYFSLLSNGCAGLKHVGVILKTFCVLPTNAYILVFSLCDMFYLQIFRQLTRRIWMVLYIFIIFLSIELFSLSVTLLPMSVLVFHPISVCFLAYFTCMTFHIFFFPTLNTLYKRKVVWIREYWVFLLTQQFYFSTNTDCTVTLFTSRVLTLVLKYLCLE